MARSLIEDNSSEKRKPRSESKRYRFEMGRFQLFLLCLGLVIALSWMFVFGILVGRGVPLVDPSDISFHAAFLRFLGLNRKTPPPKNPAQTWEDQKKMLESLHYYEDLTQKSLSLGPKSEPSPLVPQADQSDKQKLQAPPPETAEPKPQPTAEKPAQQETSPDFPSPEGATEHFTLLISSLRDAENAQRLLDQLKNKGYPARLETLDLSGSRWNRVLVGSFQNRPEAMRFAAEFNRKEKMEGLVIRESR